MKKFCKVRAYSQDQRDDFRPTPDVKLSHQEFHVPLYCVEAQAQGESDLFVSVSPDQQPNNLLFPAVEVKLPGCP